MFCESEQIAMSTVTFDEIMKLFCWTCQVEVAFILLFVLCNQLRDIWNRNTFIMRSYTVITDDRASK